MLPKRIADKIDASGPCWEWTAYRDRNGYGRTGYDGKRQYVHRVVWKLLVGPQPPGTVTDHICRNRACCNPDHLEQVTPETNARRAVGSVTMQNAAKTHCDNGHPFDEDNTYVWADGYRRCRKCNANAVRRYKARKHPE